MNRRQGLKRTSISRQARRNALVRQGVHRVGNVNPPWSGSMVNGRFWDPLGCLQK